MGEHRIRYIEPGDETLADRLAAAQDLARCAAAADAEWRAMIDDAKFGLKNGKSVYRRGDSDIPMSHEDQAMRRADLASRALALEIEELARDGAMDLLIASAGRKDFAAYAEVDMTEFLR